MISGETLVRIFPLFVYMAAAPPQPVGFLFSIKVIAASKSFCSMFICCTPAKMWTNVSYSKEKYVIFPEETGSYYFLEFSRQSNIMDDYELDETKMCTVTLQSSLFPSFDEVASLLFNLTLLKIIRFKDI